MIFKLALRNLISAGLRTWLNVFILSLSFVIIIWHYGLLDGWNRQARRDTTDWQIGGGQFWQEKYDPYDPFSIQDSHATVPGVWEPEIEANRMTPILVAQATIYPQGRMQSILLNGIDPDQTVLKIPTADLNESQTALPAVIGSRTAKSTRLKAGDSVTLRWRDVNGTFDAQEVQIAGIFSSTVPAVDNNQFYLPLDILRQMMQMPNEATFFVAAKNAKIPAVEPGWVLHTPKDLLADIEGIIKRKSIAGAFFYVILLGLAMLAIFDTQVLSIFRRQREIGTEIALGMTRGKVIRLFTVEGAMHAVLAALVAALYGIPLLSMQAIHGFALPEGTDDYGLAVAQKIFPVYSVGLILGTVLLIFITATIVSYLPSRKIAKMNPTDAIRGKLQ